MAWVIYPGLFPPPPTGAGLCVPREIEVIGLTGDLEALMALVWRVRTIKLTSEWRDGYELTELPAVITLTSTAQTESELVCGSAFIGQTTQGHFIVDEPEQDFIVSHYIQGGGDVPYVSYFPISLEGPGEFLTWGSIGVPFEFNIGQTGLTAAINFDAVDVNPISVECTEFWSYNGKYNTETGARAG